MHILLNISESKDNQTMKLGQLIEYNKGKIYLQKLCRKSGSKTNSRRLFIFKSAYNEVKTRTLQLSINIF